MARILIFTRIANSTCDAPCRHVQTRRINQHNARLLDTSTHHPTYPTQQPLASTNLLNAHLQQSAAVHIQLHSTLNSGYCFPLHHTQSEARENALPHFSAWYRYIQPRDGN
jgi:hypothetical protein